MINHNPFNTERFAEIWLKYFKDSSPTKRFDYIKGVGFYKDDTFPLYVNIGKNLTKGFYYTIEQKQVQKFRHAFLIRDVPTYFEVPEVKGVNGIKGLRARQYNGYLTDLSKYPTYDDFLLDKYSSSNRNVLRRRLKGLENSFDIRHEVYYGSIESDTYDLVMDKLHKLLIKRFSEKKTEYHILTKWEYFKELMYPMILNKEAHLYVIYESNEPIGIYLSISFGDIISGAIPVFDTDYSKFGLGNILTLKLIEWCIDNKIRIFDSSKGDYGEKDKISDLKYSFEYHILYCPKSIISTAVAKSIYFFFRGKQFLREKQLHSLYHNIKYKLTRNQEQKPTVGPKYEFVEAENENFDSEGMEPIDIKQEEFSFLRKMVYNFMYKTRDNVKDIKVFKNNNSDMYQIVGNKKTLQITELTES
ncbi:GNAT family N-acetyltransferase [Muricauda sp. JGD-17]|uniref:GNAT family N-acetyltransferase n=1 Tax=Flagellimonas ochracea TaxID=2696472 RepID=A0A964TAE6_9FLAO|nr:GNAT family N-acetyltransferase [Allomuricauda ochracea]NAY91220.1 GNAT family N-acetyltransferase [Allomuricauda ochracea]